MSSLYKALQQQPAQPQISGDNYGGFFKAMVNNPAQAVQQVVQGSDYQPQPGQPPHAPSTSAINQQPPQPPLGAADPAPQISGDNYGGFFKTMANK